MDVLGYRPNTPTLSGATRLRVFGAGRIITLRRAPPSRSSSPNGSWAAFAGPVPGNGDWRAYGPGAAATPDGGRKCDPSPDLNTHTHTQTHTHTHTHTQARPHSHMRVHTHAPIFTHTHTHTHTHHPHTSAHAHTQTHTETHTPHTVHRTPHTPPMRHTRIT